MTKRLVPGTPSVKAQKDLGTPMEHPLPRFALKQLLVTQLTFNVYVSRSIP